jgi:hypothetical protein
VGIGAAVNRVESDEWIAIHCTRCLAFLLFDEEREAGVCYVCIDRDNTMWAEAWNAEWIEAQEAVMEQSAVEGCEG